MVKKSIYFLMLIIFLLTGCGSKHQNVIDEVSNGIKEQDIPDVTMNIIEINSYIIFDVSEKDIIVRAVKKDFLETDKKLINNYNDFNEKNHFQRGCIYFKGKNIYSACGGIYNDPLLIETSDMSKVIGGIMPATLQMTLGTLLGGESVDKSLKRTKEQFVKTEYNQDVTNSFGKVINGKIYQEYKENLLSESPEKLSNFINKYNITTIKKEPYQKLISLYANQNTFNGFINAYKINNALIYADNAYKSASTKEEFEQLLFNVEKNQYKELIDKTIQRLIVIYRDENTFNSYLNAY